MYMKQYSRQTVREGTQAVKVGALGRVGENTNGALKMRNHFWCAVKLFIIMTSFLYYSQSYFKGSWIND